MSPCSGRQHHPSGQAIRYRPTIPRLRQMIFHPLIPRPPPSASASYTLTGIDFDSGSVSGLLDVDPVSGTRYEISGGLKGTVTLIDNAFEYRPTAQAQEAASAPDAGYEALYDNFDVLAIGIGGAATGSVTKIHVDVPVLGASTLASSQL